MQRLNLYKDDIYNYSAVAGSYRMAWMLIRNECIENNKPVPTLDKIKLVKVLDEDEVKLVFNP